MENANYIIIEGQQVSNLLFNIDASLQALVSSLSKNETNCKNNRSCYQAKTKTKLQTPSVVKNSINSKPYSVNSNKANVSRNGINKSKTSRKARVSKVSATTYLSSPQEDIPTIDESFVSPGQVAPTTECCD
jgi:hypothetical protein